MTKKKEPRSRDDIALGYFNRIRKLPQNRKKLENDEITENELWEAAFEYADRKVLERMEALQQEQNAKVDWIKADQKYRDAKEAQYRRDYDWSVKSDEKILENILNTEVNIRRVERKLADESLPSRERDMYNRNFISLVGTHKDLLIAAGIDRVTREKRKSTSDPMEDWKRIIELGGEKMQQLEDEFPAKMESVSSEAELRDRMKFHLGYPFEIVDAALRAHRRVLGYDTHIEKA